MKKLLIVLISVCSFQLAIAQCPDFSVGSVMSDAEDSLEDLAAEKISKAVFKKMVGRIAGGLLEPSKLSSDADKPGLYTLKEGTEEYQDAFARLDYRKMKASVKKMERGLSQAKYNKNIPSNCYSRWKSVIRDYKEFADEVYSNKSLLY